MPIGDRFVDNQRSADPSRRSVLHSALLILACAMAIAAFAPGMRAPYHFDDIDAIVRNPSLRSLGSSLSPPREMALSGRPVVNLSFALNRAWAGGDTERERFSVHATNLAIHIAAGLLLYGLVATTARTQKNSRSIAAYSSWFALAIAAAWVMHPLQTEAVHYATQRTETLMALFFLTTMFASARAWSATTRFRRRSWYVVAIIAALLGMGSKEVMVVVPLMVVLYDRAFHYDAWLDGFRGPRRRWPLYAAFAATAIIPIVLAAQNPRSHSVGLGLGITPFEYLLSQGFIIWHYVRLVFVPAGFSIDYGPNPIDGVLPAIGALTLALGFGAALFAWRRVERWGWLGFLAAWFYLILAPSSSVIPIATEIGAERRMYLPLAAVLSLVGVAAVHVMTRWPRARAIIAIASVAAIAGLGVLTVRRSAVFTDVETLWRQAVINTPANPRAPENLATVILARDPTLSADAKALLTESLERDSAYAPAWYKLGVLALNDDEVDSASIYLERAARLRPDHPDVLAELGVVYLKRADTVQATNLFQRSVAIAANDTVLVQLAQIEEARGQTTEAMRHYRLAAEVNPNRVDVRRYVAASLIETGRGRDAVQILEPLARSSAGGAMDRAMLAIAYASTGDAAAAEAAALSAANSRSTDSRVYLFAGRALVEISRPRLAEPILLRAAELSPQPAEALTVLAAAKIAMNQVEEASALLRRALSKDPTYAPARAALARLRSPTRP